jgi:hypothetical protein
MSKYYGSVRQAIERAVAGIVLGGSMLLVVSGTLAICFSGGTLGA